MPVLIDGDSVIYESAIINEYLEEKYPKVSLMPKEPAQKAQARIWIDFCNTKIHGAAHEVLHGAQPEKAKEQLRSHLLTLDQEMTGRDYIAGDYSLADITFIPVFTRQQRYGVSIDHNLPHLKRWMDRLLARPEVRSTF